MQSLIPRIVIGAGAGYLLGLFFFALNTSTLGASSTILLDAAAIFEATYPLSGLNRPMLACVAVGSVMGWAWNMLSSTRK